MIISFSSTVLDLVQKNPYIRKVLGRCSKAQMGELTGSRCLFPALCCSTFAIVGELLAVPSNTNTAELLLDEFQPSASRQRGSLDCWVLFCIGGEQVCHFHASRVVGRESVSHAETQAELRRAASSCSKDSCGSMVEVVALQSLCW